MSLAHVLITRPIEQAYNTAEKVRELGHIPVISPLLEMKFVPLTLPALPPEAFVLLTSQNAAHALASVPHDQHILCVGDKTAQAVKEKGFTNVVSVNGTSDDMVSHLLTYVNPQTTPFVYLRGRDIKQDIKTILEHQGFKGEEHIVYKADEILSFTHEARMLFEQGKISFCLFFSSHTASVFARVIEKEGLTSSLETVHALCMRSETEEELFDLPWKSLSSAPHPSGASFWTFAEHSFSRILDEISGEYE